MARKQLRRRKKKPLIIICSEGGKKNTEWYYFKNFTTRNIRIQFSSGRKTNPKGMLNDLLTYIKNEDIKHEEKYKAFLVLDTDLNSKRIKEIKTIEEECKENNIEIITSAPTFEIWYIMHYKTNKLKFNSSKEVKKELNKIIGSYTETMDMYSKTIQNIDIAKKVAYEIEENVIKNNEDIINVNPHSKVYKIIDHIEELENK